MTFTVDDIIDLTLAALGVQEIVQWPVIKGNELVIMNFVRRMVTRSRLGDRIAVTGGGYVERIATEGWNQWEYHWANEVDAAELTPAWHGRLLRGSPVVFQSPPDDDQQK